MENSTIELPRNEIDIRDQAHLMDAEGAHDFEPSKDSIKKFLLRQGWEALNIDISYDSMQQLWRWNCDIKNI